MNCSTPEDFVLLLQAMAGTTSETIAPATDEYNASPHSPKANRTSIGQEIELPLAKQDLEALRALAAAEGISYQSLITKVLLEYVGQQNSGASASTTAIQSE